jgi:hypothetical protein
VKVDLNKYYGKIFGISQIPYTKDYIIVYQNGFSEICEKCDEITDNAQCKSCCVNYLKKFFKNVTSENEQIDNLILKRQLKISNFNNTIIEFIPYNQFNNIKEICKNSPITVYSAIWKDGPLLYYNKRWTREFNKKVSLKLYELQNTSEFLNEVRNF